MSDDNIFKYLVTGVVPVSLILITILFFPEKLETWVGLAWRFLGSCGFLIKLAKRNSIRYELQGRVNSFLKGMYKEARFLVHKRVELQWVDSGATTRETFLKDDKLIIRLKGDDPNEQNFVHSVFLLVSTGILPKTKQYLSISQRKAVDLYLTGKLLQDQKPATINFFLSEYVHPETDKGKVREYFNQFANIDKHGLFYPLFLQELDLLGNKVFGKLRNSVINKEFNDLTEFLLSLCMRNIGDESRKLEFVGYYSRFYVLIVGKRAKVSQDPEGAVYVRYIKKTGSANNAETLYLIGSSDNAVTMQAVAHQLAETHDVLATHKVNTVLHRSDGSSSPAKSFVVVLRRKGVGIFQTSYEKLPEPVDDFLDERVQ